MMQANFLDKTERAARNRAVLLAMGAVIVPVTAFLRTTDTSAFAEGAGWVLMIAAWSIVLATGGGLMLNRRMRGMLNDELSVANRGRAIGWGFFAMIATSAVLLLVPHLVPDAAGAIRFVSGAGLTVAMARYALLEWQ